MASVCPTKTSSSATNKVIWSWQSNPDPWNLKQKKEWQRYSDLKNDYIEEKYQMKEGEVQLDEYVIDFKDMVQLRKDDKYRQRPVTREIIKIENYLREERFCYPDKPSKSFGQDNSVLMTEWHRKNKKCMLLAIFPKYFHKFSILSRLCPENISITILNFKRR
jgi:hypothetical protein